MACDEQPNANYRSLIEGQNYLRSGWVGQITHRLRSTEVIVLKGKVRYSQSINKYHEVEVTIQRDKAEILEVKCDCMANQGRCCSHTAGLAYKINQAALKGYIGVACTDVECLWNKSTSTNVLPDSVENIRAGDNTVAKSTFAITTAFETDEDVIRHLTTNPVAGLAAIPGTILNHVLKATAVNFSSDKAHLGLPKNHGNCEARDCDLCNKVYEKYITCDEQQREHLATATTSQDSALWQDQRKIRITSSGAFEVPKKADPKNWLDIKLNNRFMGNSSTRYGQECEPIARSYYEHTFRKKITSTGLVVHPTDNWLGASLDGIVDRDTILEIKCPTEKKLEQYNGSLTNMLQANKYDVRVVNGNYVLRQTTAGSGYYYQVQIAMHCSGKGKCNFLVWTPSEQVIVDVLYDQEWVGKQLHHLRGMYFGHLLPAISTMIAHGHLKIKGL